MRKLILCGATHGSNFGDTMFGLMFYEYIKFRYPDIDIYYTQISDYLKEWQSDSKEIENRWENTDGFIFISGGYFGDSPNENYKNMYFRFKNYIQFGLKAKRKKIPIAVIGVGAGPIKNPILRNRIISICNEAKVVSVRDEQSYNFLKKNGCKNKIFITSDSAQAIKKDEFQKLEKRNNPYFVGDKKKILVHCPTTVVSKYKEKVIGTIDKLYRNDKKVEIYFANDSVAGKNNLEEMASAFSGNNKQLYFYNDPIEFIQFLQGMDLIITPKLHVGIFSATYGKSVISFPIHPGKTKRYYQQIGYPERCIPLSEVTKEQVSMMVNQFINNPIQLSDKIYKKAEMNFELLDRFIEKYIEY